jgi:hypothetical protein
MLDINYFKPGLDTCKYVLGGIEYTAIVEEVTPTYIKVKPYSMTNWKDIYKNNLEHNFSSAFFEPECYEHINLELWSDGRGCDNSAIGVSGYYESYTHFLAEAV